MTVQIDPPVDLTAGLSRAEVDARVRAGAVNAVPEAHTRSIEDIVKANVFTRFNVLVTVLLAVIIVVAPLQDALFGLVMVINAGIGIVQEIRAKRQLERLALVSAPTAHVVREGQVFSVDVAEVVVDDLIEATAGDQIIVDGIVSSTEHIEIDESLLTGESDPVAKAPGDTVLSGSFVTAGAGRYRASKVGKDSYAAQLGEQARKFTLVRSELRNGIDWILAAISWAIVPAAAILIWSQVSAAASLRSALANAVAGTIAMVPQGLVLVTSVAFAVGVVRLAERNVLVQELPAVEGLARVDVVCFDKTGTLTEGHLTVTDTIRLDSIDPDPLLAAIAAADPSPNATTDALRASYEPQPGGPSAEGVIPFSSARKWSAYRVAGHGVFVLGAPDRIRTAPQPSETGEDAKSHGARDGSKIRDLERLVADLAGSGSRVLMLAAVGDVPVADTVAAARPVALCVLGDTVRPDAPATLEYFAEQGVEAKVISGDNPDTVRAIAMRAGVANAERVVDASTLPESGERLTEAVRTGTVFGRVSPQQKRAMVSALQQDGHTVAMTGDGVNDVLALKEADIGIAMGSGSSATRAVAQLVLMDGDFSSLPDVVAEGRRVIANIERVANLYLTKTIYAFALVVAIGLAGLAFPFLPRHLTLVGSLTIGIPSFFLALEPSTKRAEPGFIARVLRFAIPTGVLAAIATFVAYGLSEAEAERLPESRTVATIVLLTIGLFVLVVVMRPMTRRRWAVLWSMAALFFGVLSDSSARAFFDLDLPRAVVVLAAIGVVAITGALMYVALRLSGWREYVPDVVKVTQARVRDSRFSFARLDAWVPFRSGADMASEADPTSGPAAPAQEGGGGPAGAAESPADPQLSLPLAPDDPSAPESPPRNVARPRPHD